MSSIINNNKNEYVNLKVIIIDDSEVSRFKIKKMLSDSNCTVSGEIDESEKVPPLLYELNPNVALINLIMPQISGLN